MTVFYRLMDVAENDGVTIEVRKFYPIAETPQGYWVVPEYYWNLRDTFPDWLKDNRRWTHRDGGRYLHTNLVSALYSFKRRKATQLRHLKYQLEQAEQVQKGLKVLDGSEFPIKGFNCGTPEAWQCLVWL